MTRVSRFVSTLLLIGVCAVGTYIYRDPFSVVAYQVYGRILPCSAPITYKIGTIDPRFGLSQSQFLDDVQAAARVWSDASGRALFTYDQTHGNVEINLEYDSRQQVTSQLRSVGVVLNDHKAAYDAAKLQYDTTYTDYKSRKAAFANDYTAFESQKKTYEAEVSTWNARGGAPKDVYDRLQVEKTQLDTAYATLQKQQVAINADVDSINKLAATLNALIKELNLDVTQYNTIGASNGAEYEEGLYESSLGKRTITIYEYASKTKLLRVLAHELGHALGLDHVSDSEAIMYELNQGSQLKATAADIAEMKAVCRIQP